ncbi:MAG: MFS transporter [Oscillospiraceae bacterium]|nr:MFS transporter [Oscillospiraceae bacterium]
MKEKRVWLVFIGCMLYYGALMGVLYNCAGVLISGIMSEEGYSSSSLSGFFTARNLVQAVAMLATAQLFRKLNIKIVSLGVGLFTSFSFLLMPLYGSPELWTLSGILSGIGTSLSMLLPTTVINNWFVKKKGTFLGIVTMLSGILGMVLNPMVSKYITSHGWKKSAILLGGLSLTLNVIATILMEKHPEDVGALPYGSNGTNMQAYEAKPRSLGGEKLTLAEIGTYLFILFTVSMTGKGIQMTSYIPQYSTSLGYALEVGGRLTSAIMIGNFTAKFLYGIVCDWLGAWRSVQVFLGIIGSSFLMLSLFGGVLPVMYLACVFLGFSYMSGIGLSMVAVELFDKDKFETQYSRNSMFGTLVMTPIPYLVSYVFDKTGSFRIIFLTYAFFMFLAIVLISMRNKLGVIKQTS